MPIVKLPGGESIWFRKLGSGKPVLQIHGSAFGHRNFEKMTPLMQRHFEVIDFDLPGYGESTGSIGAGGMEGIAKQVYELIRAMGYDKLSVHGTSFGAMIGLTLAAKHPEVVDRLILSCFMARYDNAARMMRSTWKRAARESGMEAVADLTSVAGFARSFYERPGAQDQLATIRVAFSKNTPAAMIAGTETIERTDLTPLVPLLRAPTLMIAGAEDNMTPFEPPPSGIGMAQIAKMLPASKTVVLPNCGHYLVIEQPEKATELILEFMKGWRGLHCQL
ncbi:MAG: alpha/beta fold hydrolase [Alphaproteobacteria bacterium]|nr:alpha/beta fold hydrolase [Alphaproteobacteria bacterium]